MRIAYIGFSNISGNSYLGASNAGIAQSDFTFKIINEISDADYYICQSSPSVKSDRDNYFSFRLRTRFHKNIIDTFRLLRILRSYGPYKSIVIYHSLVFFPLVLIFRLFCINHILQVNEIFYRSGTHNFRVKKLAENWMFKCTKNFIVASETLTRFLSQVRKAETNIVAVIPGPIYVNKDLDLELKTSILDIDTQSVVQIMYAGVIDKEKNGGAFIAIELANKLDSINFNIDIFGFGRTNDINDLQKAIELNNLKSRTKVRYRGNLPPLKLFESMNNYHIGLATQYIGTSFSESSFPSKILMYLSAGLNVVSATSSAVASWAERDLIFIYKDKDLNDLVSYLQSNRLKNKSVILRRVQKIRNKISYNLAKSIQ